MLNQKETRETLRKIAFKLTRDEGLLEDLTQEALIHLWLREQEYPGQTRSWYLQSCDFFLRNYLRNGRSVDSPRHRGRLLPWELRHQDAPGEKDGFCEPVGLVSAREILALLDRWLTPAERQILQLLAQGFAVREVASRLKLSHTSVVRHRRRIAEVAVRMGVEPVPPADRT